MSEILVLKSSFLGENSQSNHLIDQAIEGKENLVIRDLAEFPIPVLDSKVATAIRGQEDELEGELKELLILSNELVRELKAADKIVIGAPMYNFAVPTQLKNWFDMIARVGLTFKYTQEGPVGLVDNKKVIVLTTRGGIHQGSSRDTVHSYLSTMLNFIGISDIEFVYAEGLNMGEEEAKVSREQALDKLITLV